MSEWGIALIAAAAAVAGSLVTGWFARSAGERQAAAMVATVRMSIAEQRSVRMLEQRRVTYLRFLEAAEGRATDRAALRRAFDAVTLEGPTEVAESARTLVDRLRGERSLDEIAQARAAFVAAAGKALRPLDDEA
ncbi:hypothetical protein [Streptomyces sp. NPDC127098]|uniref:hypothetical protein n=1 Tax=Streptomyces sp. NPDC127098 TaxID=3347137 RepID=UPI00365A3FFE